MVTFEMFLGTRIGSVLRAWTEKITAINKKYETPRIRMSRSVKIALLFLRIYLILLVLLLCYKFYTLLT
jgi:ribosomal protein S30